MSTINVHRILPAGRVAHWGAAHNAHRGASYIWDSVARYLVVLRLLEPPEDFPWQPWHARYGDPAQERMCAWLSRMDYEPLWPMARDARVPAYLRLALACTYDGMVYWQADIPQVVAALRAFRRTFPEPWLGPGYDNPNDPHPHASGLPPVVRFLEALAVAPRTRGACVGWTSVASYPWDGVATADGRGWRHYNVDRDTDHVSIREAYPALFEVPMP